MIVRYQHPLQAFRQLDREFDRLVRLGFGRGAVRNSPEADVYTEGSDLVFTVAAPGVGTEDVTVTLEGRRLSIEAERRRRESSEGDRYLHRGLAAGRLSRVFTVPEGVEPSQVSAELADGLLTVRVADAVRPAPEARRIPVREAGPAIEAEAAE
ncbi:Hsp20/alpha crystallin family protein [Glycomyces xiaoerkulensis]|uniref:Hsp20/alpha crystallin family protein n=1 Tax=Glycomyces xiaoerkulensis TaxID=2038139 RepID=UPI000C26955D|nr:Hsp20/alpha crystallin family protein [Glycomyces xiaoerkulensis]